MNTKFLLEDLDAFARAVQGSDKMTERPTPSTSGKSKGNAHKNLTGTKQPGPAGLPENLLIRIREHCGPFTIYPELPHIAGNLNEALPAGIDQYHYEVIEGLPFDCVHAFIKTKKKNIKQKSLFL